MSASHNSRWKTAAREGDAHILGCARWHNGQVSALQDSLLQAQQRRASCGQDGCNVLAVRLHICLEGSMHEDLHDSKRSGSVSDLLPPLCWIKRGVNASFTPALGRL